MNSALQRAQPWWETLALFLRSSDCSLDAPIDQESGGSWGERLVSDEPEPDSAFARAEADASVRAAVDALPPRLAAVIRMRFGFDDDGGMTLVEVGHAMGLSRERIRQLEREALQMLRRAVLREAFAKAAA